MQINFSRHEIPYAKFRVPYTFRASCRAIKGNLHVQAGHGWGIVSFRVINLWSLSGWYNLVVLWNVQGFCLIVIRLIYIQWSYFDWLHAYTLTIFLSNSPANEFASLLVQLSANDMSTNSLDIPGKSLI